MTPTQRVRELFEKLTKPIKSGSPVEYVWHDETAELPSMSIEHGFSYVGSTPEPTPEEVARLPKLRDLTK